jgi:hypothetical protein
LALALSGCGGGGSGGGVASTPPPVATFASTPTPSSTGASTPPPVATNTSLAELTVSQSFTNDAATLAAIFNLSNSTTTSGTANGSTLTINYAADSNTYTISTQGRSQSFTAADLSSSSGGQAVYQKSDGTNRDVLTLEAATFGNNPQYVGGGSPQYVGMGFWQRNVVQGSTQSISYDGFAYGLATPASAVPRVGQATMATVVFGLTTVPGYEPQSFSGTGAFNVDFEHGIFNTGANVTETGLFTGATSEPGRVLASGTLSTSDGAFSGLVNYWGLHANDSGTLNGRLYGPAGQEMGAVFSATGSDGSATIGEMTGYIPPFPTHALVNFTLSDLVQDQVFSTRGEGLFTSNTTAGVVYQTSIGLDFGQLTQYVSGGLVVPAFYDLPTSQYAATDKISGAANFTTYRKVTDGQTVTTEIYNPGNGNSELALTYTSFAHIFDNSGGATSTVQEYEVFGQMTDPGLLIARAGTAHYSGVAYGAGGSSTTGATYAVTGQSAFDVNFGTQSLTGSLALNGASAAGAVNFGTFSFASIMERGQGVTTPLNQGATAVGTITPQFYGPLGEEIGAAFQMSLPAGTAGAGTSIAGVGVAKGG